jgi:hypothetical protein
LFCIGCQRTIKETSPYEYSVNDIMSNVAARQRSEKNAMLQDDGQVDHRPNLRWPLRGPEALNDTSPCTLRTGCSIALHRYNVSPLLGERMQAIDRNDETDLKYLDLKPLTELRRIAPQGEGVAWW